MPKKNLFFVFFTFICCIVFLFFTSFLTYADELDNITKQINELTSALQNSQKATAPLESQLMSMQKQIADIKIRVTLIEQDTAEKRKAIDEGYKKLAAQQEQLNAAVKDYYIKSYYNTPIVTLLSAPSASEITRQLAYQKIATDQDKQIMLTMALTIQDLEEKKYALENEEKRLVIVKASLDQQSAKLDETVKGAKDYQAKLSGQIAELSAKQQEIINAKSGGFTFSLADGELADEYLSSIKGFRESAPSGYFAIFSFGAYSHRNGMSQYGARARAEQGQSSEDILKVYYPNATLKKDYPVNGTINVEGYGSMPFEDQYLQGIYEMPGSWHVNALKAQAIAARTYAVKRTNNGQGSICTTQSCQVFKNERKGGNWEIAVNETKGWVLVDGEGNPISTEYASTHGGWSKTSGWDTTDKSGGPSFIDKSYEKLGNSPWLYKAWWRKGTSNSGDTCGRSNPWLSPQELADIVNAYIALKKTIGGIDTARVTPITTSCWGGNPYSMDDLRNLTAGKGGISEATNVSVSQGDGQTNNVTINGVTLSGNEFREMINVRAPGYISIPQSQSVYGSPFFNIEKK